jgi:hypothetical protein
VKEDQALTARYRGASELREPTPPWWGSSSRPTGVPAEQVVDVDRFEIGSVTVGAATCLTAKGWRLVSPIDVDVRSQGLTTIEGTNVRNSDIRARSHGLSRGWGLGIHSRHRGRLDIQLFECEESRFWQTVGVATNVPIPKIDIRWEIVRFGVGLLLPEDTATCGDFGISELHVFPDRNGRLVLAPGRDRTRTHRAALPAGRSERVYAEPRPTVRAAHPDPPPEVKD